MYTKKALYFFTAALSTTLITYSEEFSGEPYLIGYSVPINGTAGAMPSMAGAPSRFIDFPGEMQKHPEVMAEIASLPLYGGLSEILSGTALMPLDSNTEIGVFGAMVTDDEIYARPSLNYTKNERLTDPKKRPGKCGSCAEFRAVSYLAYLNIKRQFPVKFPYSDFFSSSIPVTLTIGSNIKFLKDELEGADYIAQNLNLDLGLCLRLEPSLGFSRISARRLTLCFSGFELLQTNQTSSDAKEKIDSRYHLSFNWLEKLPGLNSTFQFGIINKSEWGKIPGVGIEWGFKGIAYLRAGIQNQFISGGVSLRYKFVSFHYAMVHHYLGTSPYQLSLQFGMPFKGCF